ncbi:hypothetical protein PGQ11_014461 [Apiospora arundinis]|uniref:Uncharacterized protein n=1 Tax=Apiospora arundinis TaxID=335852 RepID=A0ABR2HTI8_9PEZI
MATFLQDMGADATIYYHGQEKGWSISADEHPCIMLAYNDKWWRLNWDAKYLSRLGDKRRAELSCTPTPLRDRYYRYSAGECLYCTGYYDDTIIQQIGQAPQDKYEARML